MKSLILAIVLLFLNWGLIPERNTMNTCVDISEQVASELARPELVVDYNGEDFTPTPTFLRIMNAAHQHLDRRFSHENRSEVTRLPLAQGQWWLDLPAGLKYISRIDLEDADGNIVPNGGLGRRTLAYLRDRYGQTFGLVAEGQPQEWARAIGEVIAGAEKIENGDFAADLSGWTASQGWTWEDGVAKFSYPGIGGTLSQLFTEQDLSGNTLRFDAVLSAGATVTIQFWGITGFPAPIFVAYDNITASGSYEIALPPLTRAGISFLCLTAGAVVTLDNVSIATDDEADCVVMPPADQAYTAVVYHTAYASPWVENTDVSWWSDKHPDILVLAIKRQVELELNRNSTGVKDYDSTLELALFDVETDAGMESQAGPTEAFRFGWHP